MKNQRAELTPSPAAASSCWRSSSSEMANSALCRRCSVGQLRRGAGVQPGGSAPAQGHHAANTENLKYSKSEFKLFWFYTSTASLPTPGIGSQFILQDRIIWHIHFFLTVSVQRWVSVSPWHMSKDRQLASPLCPFQGPEAIEGTSSWSLPVQQLEYYLTKTYGLLHM